VLSQLLSIDMRLCLIPHSAETNMVNKSEILNFSLRQFNLDVLIFFLSVPYPRNWHEKILKNRDKNQHCYAIFARSK